MTPQKVPLLPLRAVEEYLPFLKSIRIYFEETRNYRAYTGLAELTMQTTNRHGLACTMLICDFPHVQQPDRVTLAFDLLALRNLANATTEIHVAVQTGDTVTAIVDTNGRVMSIYNHWRRDFGFRHLPRLFIKVNRLADIWHNGIIYFLLLLATAFLIADPMTNLLFFGSAPPRYLRELALLLNFFLPFLVYYGLIWLNSYNQLLYRQWIIENCTVEEPKLNADIFPVTAAYDTDDD